MPTDRVRKQRGGALLAVLWLAAGLSAIAFSLAQTVRTETGRTSNAIDGVRAYYLATGAIERALLYMEWGPRASLPDGSSRFYSPWTTSFAFSFPTGEAIVEIVPEAAKMNINAARPEEIFRLLLSLGAEAGRAREITDAILDWRTVRGEGQGGMFDPYYMSLNPSFRARHASLEETEELLLVKGMTAELFHGGFFRDANGRLVSRDGLKDCVSVWGSGAAVDVNTAPPAVLAAVGLRPDQVATVVEARAARPFRLPDQIRSMGLGEGPAAGRLRIGGGSIYTLRATARLRTDGGGLSDLRRSVAATVKLLGYSGGQPHHVLRWQENVWVR